MQRGIEAAAGLISLLGHFTPVAAAEADDREFVYIEW